MHVVHHVYSNSHNTYTWAFGKAGLAKVRVYACGCLCMNVCIHDYACMQTHTYPTHTRMHKPHTHTHTHTHTYTHTHTHTHTCRGCMDTFIHINISLNFARTSYMQTCMCICMYMFTYACVLLFTWFQDTCSNTKGHSYTHVLCWCIRHSAISALDTQSYHVYSRTYTYTTKYQKKIGQYIYSFPRRSDNVASLLLIRNRLDSLPDSSATGLSIVIATLLSLYSIHCQIFCVHDCVLSHRPADRFSWKRALLL